MVVISDMSITSAATSANLWAARAYFSDMVKARNFAAVCSSLQQFAGWHHLRRPSLRASERVEKAFGAPEKLPDRINLLQCEAAWG